MSETNYTKVGELAPNVKEVNLVAKVVELGEIREVTNRQTGEEHKVMDVLIGDETGTVYFSAWNEHIDSVQENETYQFLNAKTILFRRNIRVSLGRSGQIEGTEEEIDKVETENNISSKEYEDARRYHGRGSYQKRRDNY
ncbi:MAG: single-stranded DNA-binding protein [Candidatus Heimdallarchaeota archaeon]|nr:single-stranded DNA-binding protein [Candidatus Heimdallarchaeota archaeon]MCK4770241.1 single-stranded DNA-binding protein [Candidatus Heimdallarchaeota archaeon]